MPPTSATPAQRLRPRLAPVAPTPPPRAEVLGIPLALTDYARTMDWIDEMVRTRSKGYVTAAAVHLVMVAQEDPETRAAVLNATLAVPDGQPLVWALQALGHDEPSRVYGPELMARYCARSARSGTRMYLYGGRNQGALVKLTRNLRERYRGIKIVGGYSPPFRETTNGSRARSTPRVPTSSGSGPVSPSRRSGWRGCANGSTCRC